LAGVGTALNETLAGLVIVPLALPLICGEGICAAMEGFGGSVNVDFAALTIIHNLSRGAEFGYQIIDITPFPGSLQFFPPLLCGSTGAYPKKHKGQD
jgi:hypothetical protein